MTRSSLAILAGVFTLAFSPACQREDISGPPSLRLGLDLCIGCGMLIMEDQSSCSLLVTQDGDRAYLHFDDPGCLLDYRADNPSTPIVDQFVHDYQSRQWLIATKACYLVGVDKTLSTPMGSGIVAFSSPTAANAQRTTSGGDVTHFEQLANIRRAWRDAQRARSSGTP